MPLIPMVVEQDHRGERAYDIYSRLLQGPHRLPRQRDQRRRRQPRHRPAPLPRGRGSREGHQPLHQLPGRLRHRRPRHLRHDAVRPPGRRDALHRTGGLHGGGAAGGGRPGQALRAAQLAGHDPPALGRLPGAGHGHRHPGAGDPAHASTGSTRSSRNTPASPSRRSRRTPTGITISRRDEAQDLRARRPGHDDGGTRRSCPLGDRKRQAAEAPSDEEEGRQRESLLLLLRQEPEGGEEAHRGSDGLHLRRVHRALQRHHRRGVRARGGDDPLARRFRSRARSRRSSTST